MNRYYCELEGGAGGTRHGVRPAIGICPLATDERRRAT
jgi:hypothetical protein